MNDPRYLDLLKQGFMKPRKVGRKPATAQQVADREAKRRALADHYSKILKEKVTYIGGGKFNVPHPGGHSNVFNSADLKRYATGYWEALKRAGFEVKV